MEPKNGRLGQTGMELHPSIQVGLEVKTAGVADTNLKDGYWEIQAWAD